MVWAKYSSSKYLDPLGVLCNHALVDLGGKQAHFIKPHLKSEDMGVSKTLAAPMQTPKTVGIYEDTHEKDPQI